MLFRYCSFQNRKEPSRNEQFNHNNNTDCLAFSTKITLSFCKTENLVKFTKK